MVKIGILGTGFGVVHVETFVNHPLVSEIVVFSRKQESLDPIIKQFGVISTTKLEDILTDPDIKIVTIALPPKLQVEFAIKAMEHGKDVICEIPVSPILADIETLTAVSHQTGKRVLVDLFDRFTTPAKIAHEMINSGEYGRVCHVSMTNAAGPVWGNHPLPLNALPMEMSYSDFDFLSWCLGDLQVKSVAAVERDEHSSAASTLLEGLNGLPIVLTNSALPTKVYAVQSCWQIFFEEATLSYYEKSWSTAGDNKAEMLLYSDDEVQSIDLPKHNHYFASLDYSLRKIVSGEKGLTDLEQSIPVLKLVMELEQQLKS
ncbi:Gfo/Idh/MocA family protein [Enterococcus sp. AZ196]|uniref:Gfo/Idh/MocA family protein n=1 Tax=Enterococcus sp. AZ196 TaxID=2774659 RepID=UPI003D29CC6B